MAETTGITWCDSTFNPWRGCTKVSPGCDHCYAERDSHRNPKVLGEWGPGANRVEAAESYWSGPVKWCKEARRLGVRRRVFCASLADVFDAEAPVASRRRLWETITSTSGQLWGFEKGGLDWLLLTKRPERIGSVVREDGLSVSFFHHNRCWVGVSIESQEYIRRFWKVAHWSPVPWISAEPLLGPLEMPNVLDQGEEGGRCKWVVVGGESGRQARRMAPEWAEGIIRQCAGAGVACFFKQAGEVLAREWGCASRQGSEMGEVPETFQVRQFPEFKEKAANAPRCE
jgi:protein gp37